MAHLALYRTYRPQNFDSVVGQKHIIQTIKNQIKNHRLAHAYMLSGPRGTGKTSIARIVAKAVNCENSQDGNPCNACISCQAVNNGNHPDVLELDGASNNGVDDIREIRERVKYSPSLSPYKVYIIDEVHMLSTGAFNALLKTLEEPPQHVIFIMATTEIHKVLETILSRVQRFDLKQIALPDMRDFLKKILTELEIEFEAEVPELVAKLAAGGLRDALSMIDQAIAYKTETIKIADIHDLNGSVAKEALEEIVECIATSDFAGIMESTRLLLTEGKLPERIVDGLLEISRNILKAQKIGDQPLTGIAKQINSEQVFHLIKQLNHLSYELKIAANAELILEVGLIELGFKEQQPLINSTSATTNQTSEMASLMTQMQELRAELASLRKHKLKPRPLPAVAEPENPVDGALTSQEAPALSKTVAPEIPVFVQGELVNHADVDLPSSDAAGTLLIEDILTKATKSDKLALQNKITVANPFAELEIKEVVMLLKDAQIVAASASGCILVYEYETTAQKLLMATNQQQALQILAEMMGKPYGFLALPTEFWTQTRASYVEQTKLGNVPILPQYPQQPKVKPPAASPTSTAKEPFYQEIVDLFGDLVEVAD